jgi:hypothetical protein
VAIDGGIGIDFIDYRYQNYSESFIDQRVFSDDQFTNIESILINNSSTTLLKLNKESLLNLESGSVIDVDGDGDNDDIVWIYGDSSLDNIVLDVEGWTYLKSEEDANGYDWDYYQNDNGETYFATTSGIGVYQINSTSSVAISNTSIVENVENVTVGTLSISNGDQLSSSGSINFTLSGDDADKFELGSDNILRLKTGTVANYENKSSYNVTVTMTYTLGSETKTIGVGKDFTISVTDAEENTISGSGSSETITGTDIDDHIDSDGGNDNIDGGAGNDTLLLFANKSYFDTINLAGVTKIEGHSGTIYQWDTITMINVETIMYANQTVTVDAVLNDANYIFDTGSGNTITGTSGDDVIDSDGGNDNIDGGAGNDTLLLFADKSKFNITVIGDTVKIEGHSGTIYQWDTITMTNVETIMFADQTVNISDLTSQGSVAGKPEDAGNTPMDDEESDNNEVDENTLSDVDLWANEFDLNSITLPETVFDNLNESVDFIDVNESLGFESDSLAINFDMFSEDSVVADVQPVKIVPTVTYHASMEYHENSSIEDLVYSSELG